MFGIFKKKPIEIKYGRDNYLQDYKGFEANDRNWILMLSALFVEAKDLDMGEKCACHDLLEIYPEGMLDEDEKEELNNALRFNKLKGITKRMKQVAELEIRGFENDAYLAINAKSLEEAQHKAHKKYEDDDEKLELFETIWKNKERYKDTHLRLGFIVHTMWQIRMAACLGKIDSDTAWSHLETLADFARPIMNLYTSWESYNENLQKFREIYDFEDFHGILNESKYVEYAKICLLKREESPLSFIPIDFGVDKSYDYNIKSHSLLYAKRLPSGQTPTHLMLLALSDREDKRQLWEELDKMEQKEKEKMSLFVENHLRESMEEEDILELPERYENVYAYSIRADYFYNFAWEARGSGTADTVGEDNYNLFYERLSWALDDLLKAHNLAPNDRNIWHDLYEILSHFEDEELRTKREELYTLMTTKALDHRGCVYVISRFKETRWGGSFEENLDWARTVIAGTPKGHTNRLIIYDVMIEHYDYIETFNEDKKAAEAFICSAEVQSEVNQYFEELVENISSSPYYIVDTLTYFYSKVGDIHRLRQAIHASEIGRFDLDAMHDEYEEDSVENMMNWFRSI